MPRVGPFPLDLRRAGGASMQISFTILIVLQFLVIVLHDWLDIPGWTHGRQVRAVVGPRTLAIATAINAVFPGIAVALAIRFLGRPWTAGAANYCVAYCGITALSAATM